jgi:hypothetical protein
MNSSLFQTQYNKIFVMIKVGDEDWHIYVYHN